VKVSTGQAEERAQISVRLTPDLYAQINARAAETGLSMNRTVLQLLSAGLEAERNKRLHLEEMLRRYRESTDPQETERLGNDLREMISGR
jgi:HicB family